YMLSAETQPVNAPIGPLAKISAELSSKANAAPIVSAFHRLSKVNQRTTKTATCGLIVPIPINRPPNHTCPRRTQTHPTAKQAAAISVVCPIQRIWAVKGFPKISAGISQRDSGAGSGTPISVSDLGGDPQSAAKAIMQAKFIPVISTRAHENGK